MQYTTTTDHNVGEIDIEYAGGAAHAEVSVTVEWREEEGNSVDSFWKVAGVTLESPLLLDGTTSPYQEDGFCSFLMGEGQYTFRDKIEDKIAEDMEEKADQYADDRYYSQER